MASRGIGAVSLREINTAAAQKNASGVQYHFGNRTGLIAAILERHMQRADVLRNQLLDGLQMRRNVTPAEVVAAVVAPLAAELETRSGRAYLQLLDQLLDRPEIATLDVTAGLNRSLDRAAQLLTRSMQHLPRAVAAARRQLCTAFLLRSLADRARAIESHAVGANLAQPAFVANLVDVLVAVLTTDASASTRRAVRRKPSAPPA